MQDIMIWKKESQATADSGCCSLKWIGEQYLEAMRPTLKESSYIKYLNMFRLYILPYLGTADIRKITSGQLDMLSQTLLTKGSGKKKKGLSQRSVQSVLRLLHNILKFGFQKSGTDLELPVHQPIRISGGCPDILSKGQQKILCRHLEDHVSQRGIGILVSLYLGLRLGEVCALTWENILLEDRVLSVRSTMQRIQNISDDFAVPKTKIILTPPKSRDSIRDLPIPEVLIKNLSIARAKAQNNNAYLLTGRNDHFIENRNMEYYFTKTLEECGLPHFHYHCLRHTFATRCAEAGMDPKTLSAILGHSSVNTTFNLYVHVTMDMKRENLKKLAGYFT